jgi:hypothetical protein
METGKLKEIILDQQDVFNKKTDLIARDIELEKFISSSLVVVISGIRRCGKSSLLYLIKEKMKLKEGEYLYFNFDDERIANDISILDQLYNIHLELYDRKPVLFFDEVQNISGWEKFINRMFEKNIKVFVTGSNAKLLSSEISTSLTGRNKVIELTPFSFREFLVLSGNKYNLKKICSESKNQIKKDFDFYFRKGGFPLVDKENDLELINAYFQDILYRDIISRFKLIQIEEIKQIGIYFMSNIGKLFSYSTLKDISGVKSSSSIKAYLDYYSQTYLFFYLKKFDFSIKKQILNPKKVYVIDQAFATRIGFNFSENKGRILENIVFLELRRRNKDIYYHQSRNECDFIIKDAYKVNEAIQVCYFINPDNKNREVQGLLEAMKQYKLKKGLILTYEQEYSFEAESLSINVLPVWKWLLEKEAK